jgi:hypothetical protein
MHDQHNIVPHRPKFSNNLHKFIKYKKLRHTVPAALTIYGPMQSTVLVSPSSMVKQRYDTGFLRTLLGNKLGNKFDYV